MKHNVDYTRGESHPKHKLTEQDVMNIRYAYYDGAKQEYLAKKYGVKQPLISRIVNGQTWNHLPVLGGRKNA